MWFPGGDRSQIVDEELRMSSVGIRRGNGAVGVGRKSVETVVVIDVVVASWTNGEN